MRKLRLAFAVLWVVALGSQGGWSQTQRIIKIIYPFPPGGSADIVARLLADQINRSQGVSTIVESRPGAGSVIGTEAVSRAAPDGNTLLMPANSFVINRIVRKLSYDPLSFEPVCLLARAAHVVTVNSGLAVPHSGRLSGCCPRTTRRVDQRQRRPRHRAAYCARNAQARR
jgi:tripartite-type tricarboxylate transporter receptor subunit TctC